MTIFLKERLKTHWRELIKHLVLTQCCGNKPFLWEQHKLSPGFTSNFCSTIGKLTVPKRVDTCVLYWNIKRASNVNIYKNMTEAISWSIIVGKVWGGGVIPRNILHREYCASLVRSLVFLYTTKTTGLIAKNKHQTSHQRLYFCNKVFQMCSEKK